MRCGGAMRRVVRSTAKPLTGLAAPKSDRLRGLPYCGALSTSSSCKGLCTITERVLFGCLAGGVFRVGMCDSRSFCAFV